MSLKKEIPLYIANKEISKEHSISKKKRPTYGEDQGRIIPAYFVCSMMAASHAFSI
jgi:hypothetical protein